MCRMMVVMGDADVQRQALLAFHPLGRHGCVRPWECAGHLDGWGMATYCGSGPQKIHASAGDVDSERALYLAAVDRAIAAWGVLSMVHFRKATCGEISAANTQPILEGRWMFAHNGTVENLDSLGPQPAMTGSTDSENFFRRWCGQGKEISGYRGWVDAVATHCGHTSITTLLTDGQSLVACRRVNQERLAKCPEGHTPMTIDRAYTLFHWNRGNAHIISSEALDVFPGDWRLLADGECLSVNIARST